MKRYLAIILLGVTVITVVLYFSVFKVDLREYKASDVTIPNDSLAYLKSDMTLVTGLVTSKYDNGQLAEQTTFKNGVRDGLFKLWYKKSGQLGVEGNYKNGKKNGMWKAYFKNGQIHEERHYTDNGKLNGIQKTWHKNGQLHNETRFIKGKEAGVAKMWFDSGQLRAEFNYSNGVMNGIYRMWHPNGQLGLEGIYQNGIFLDTISMYSEEGIDLKNTASYRSVLLINGEWMFVDQEGDSGKVSFNNGNYKSYRSNSNLKETGVYRINGKQLTLIIDNGPEVVMNIDTINSDSLELSLVSDINHKIKGIKTSK